MRGARVQVLNSERKPTVLRQPVQHLIPLEVTHEKLEFQDLKL